MLYVAFKHFMKKIVFVLLLILGFLFLHSETGLLKDCEDNHKNHDVCTILQNLDNSRLIAYSNSLHNILKISIPKTILNVQPTILIDSFLKESKLNDFPHRLKNKIFIHFLNSLLI